MVSHLDLDATNTTLPYTLQVAGGTGRNLDYLAPGTGKGKEGGNVASLTIVDLCQGMVAQMEAKLKARCVRVRGGAVLSDAAGLIDSDLSCGCARNAKLLPNLRRRADVTFGVMDVTKLAFPSRSFDTVVRTHLRDRLDHCRAFLSAGMAHKALVDLHLHDSTGDRSHPQHQPTPPPPLNHNKQIGRHVRAVLLRGPHGGAAGDGARGQGRRADPAAGARAEPLRLAQRHPGQEQPPAHGPLGLHLEP